MDALGSRNLAYAIVKHNTFPIETVIVISFISAIGVVGLVKMDKFHGHIKFEMVAYVKQLLNFLNLLLISSAADTF